MAIFRNNNRRGRFRSNDRSFKRTGDVPKYKSDFNVNGDFKRNSLSRNNHNASKLVEKYNDLAREALANEDKILSESYFQYADHFTRVQNEQEKNRTAKVNATATEVVTPIKTEEKQSISNAQEEKKDIKPIETKSATS